VYANEHTNWQNEMMSRHAK